MNWIKILTINVAVFLALIGLLILLPPFAFTITQLLSSKKENRLDLAVYEPFDWEAKHFKEYYSLSTSYNDYNVWRRDDFSGETINIIDGLRKTSKPKKRNSDEEYWFFGGSTTWGVGVNDKNTYPSLVAKNLMC